MTVLAGIPDGATVLVDTNPLVYLLEDHPLAARFDPIFAAIDAGRLRALVTPITLAEVVAGPLRSGNDVLAERYRRTLTDNPSWTLCDIDAEITVLAARLRARHRLKLPDAIQLATALREGCAALVTHDRDFAGVSGIAIVGVD